MDGLKVERKIERGERRGTRVGTLAAAVRDTLGGRRTNCSLTRSLSRSIERGDIGRKGDSWWSQLDCQESAQMQTFSTPREKFPQSKNSLLVEVGDCYRELCVFVLALSTLFAA